MRAVVASRYLFWAILLLPSIPLLVEFTADTASAERLLHPSGEFSARFMIIAMMISPLRLLFPKAQWLQWLMRRRRYLGVAAAGYALLHTYLYMIDMGALQPMLDEFRALGIWTGWGAFAILVPLALTSNNWSQRLLRFRWKQLQRLVYPAAVLTLVHWIYVHNNLGPALAHFVPLAALEAYRVGQNIWNTERPSAATATDSRMKGNPR